MGGMVVTKGRTQRALGKGGIRGRVKGGRTLGAWGRMKGWGRKAAERRQSRKAPAVAVEKVLAGDLVGMVEFRNV